MNGLDAIHRQDVTGGWTGKLVGAMAGATGDGQRIYPGICDKLRCLLRVCQQLVVAQFSGRPDAIFLARFAGFQRSKTANFSLNGHTAGMRHINDLPGHTRVVVVIHRRLAILTQRAVHHDRAEAQLNRTLANRS